MTPAKPWFRRGANLYAVSVSETGTFINGQYVPEAVVMWVSLDDGETWRSIEEVE